MHRRIMKDLTIKFTATIKEAMEALGKTAEKVLVVVDEQRRMVGALTDGDIRRYILQGHDLDGTIAKAYNPKSTYIFEKDYDLEQAKTLLMEKRICLIPVLDDNHVMVDYITLAEAFGQKEKPSSKKILDIPVVIMAGGRGTRLEPFTKVLPKPLIPVGDKPIIEHIIDRFMEYGIKEYFLTINHKSKIIKAYFEEKNPDYSIGFAEEDEPRGTAGSLTLLKDKLNKPFFVSNCDIIIEADYSDIFRFHIKNNYDITLVASAKQFNIPYGICELNGNGSLKRIQEKPEYNFLVNTGFYVLNPNVIDLIPDNGLFHITHLMDKIKENNGTIGVYPVSENAWIDVGQWAEYRKTLKTFDI